MSMTADERVQVIEALRALVNYAWTHQTPNSEDWLNTRLVSHHILDRIVNMHIPIPIAEEGVVPYAFVGGIVFTWNDVELAEDEALLRGAMAMDDDENPVDRKKQAALYNLAKRLSKILPPREGHE